MKFDINKKSDITDAIIVGETVNSETKGENEIKTEEKEVVIDTSGEKQEITQEETKLESGSVNSFSDIINKKVKSSENIDTEKTKEQNKKVYENSEESEFSNMKASEYREKFIKEENEDPTIGDLEAEAESMFDILDTIIIFVISIFAKDKYESNYELSLAKKKRITRAITRWLIVRKKGVMPAWLSAIVIAGTAYMGSFKRAKENRMKVLNTQPIEVKARVVKEKEIYKPTQTEVKEEVPIEKEIKEIKKEIKKRGRVPNAHKKIFGGEEFLP